MIRHPALSFVARGAAANVLGRVWIAVAQLASIPVLTTTWGRDGFGLWLMLSTIPAYLALSDIGLGSAASTEMTARLVSGDQSGALATFQSVWFALTLVSGLAGFAAFSVCALFVVQQVALPANEALVALGALCLYALLVVQMSACFTAYHATRRFASGTLFSDLSIPLEACGVMLVAVLGGGIAAAAVALVVVRLPIAILFYACIRNAEPWIGIGVRHASFATVWRLVPASMATLALTAAHAALLQGVVLALGLAAGPATAAIYASARTLTRIPVQLAGAVSRASVPELTRAQAAADASLGHRLGNGVVHIALLIAVPCCVVLSIWGRDLLALLSGGALIATPTLFGLLAAAALVYVLSSASASPAIAANQHGRFAYIYLASGTLAAIGVLGLAANSASTAAALVLVAELAGFVAVLVARKNRE